MNDYQPLTHGQDVVPAQEPLRHLLSHRLRRIGHEFAKFGTVGALAYVIDIGMFNILRYAGGEGILYDKPLTAKTISVVLATTFSYFGNRNWTFRRRRRSGFRREYSLFILLNAVALLITLGCLATSHYLLGFTSPVADNISANFVGLGLGTAFRFWSYRRWVFRENDSANASTERDIPNITIRA
jgi:putative flippase GtrA